MSAGYGEFRDGWPVVLASTVGIALGVTPIPFYTIGLLAPELSKAFHWGLGDVMLGMLIMSLVVLVSAPAAGAVAERFGVRIVALVSMVLFGLSFMSLGLSSGSLLQYYLTWSLIGVVGAGTLPITFTRAINNRFEVRKGFALGLALMGTGIFGILCKAPTAWLIETVGWRGTYVALGLLPIVIALPIGILFFHDSPGLRSREGRQAAKAQDPADTPGLTFRQALRDWRLWLIGAAVVATGFALGGPVPNMESILKTNGFALATIVTLTPLSGFSVIIGRVAAGWLMDRFWAPAVAFSMLLLPAASCWILAHGPLTYETAFLAISLIGLCAGMESDLVAFLIARYFGLRNYTSIYSLVYVFYAMSASLAAWMFGAIFDRTQSFDAVLTVCALILIGGAAAFLALGRYRFARHEPAVAGEGGAAAS